MSVYVPPRPVKAGPVGPGAGVLMTEYLLPAMLPTAPAQKIRQAWKLGISTPWIRAAERVLASKVASITWHLEDAAGEEIDKSYPRPQAQEAVDLIARPQAAAAVGKRLSRRDLWALTCRHVGLCGNAFWYLDEQDSYGIPRSCLYIRPDRMTPIEDAAGNLLAWALDRSVVGSGMRLELNEVIQFVLDPPDEGHYGIGLVESALLKAQLATATDKHMAAVIGAGGRLSGLLSPKSGAIDDDDKYQQMVRDWRNIVEQPEAAKRLQIIRAPVDFHQTTASPQELGVVHLMTQMRDDLLALWGVPLSQVGGTTPAGLNGGDQKKFDEAAIWQGPVHDRLSILAEGVQSQVLDPFAGLLDFVPRLVLEEPSFDDDSPRYDLLAKSLNSPLRNRERRDLIGLPPFGDPAIDEAVWMPITLQQVYAAPPPEPPAGPPSIGFGIERDVIRPDAASLAAGETSAGDAVVAKADGLLGSMRALRDRLSTRWTPQLKGAVGTVLAAQRADITARVRGAYDHIKAQPRDATVWFAPRWDEAMRAALAPGVFGMAQAISLHVGEVLPPVALPVKADAVSASERVLRRGVTRVGGINRTTRDRVASLIAANIDEGGTLDELIRAIEDDAAFDDYRAELIARTELMDAYNAAALASYGDAGLNQVQALDGDDDDVCASRNGQVFDIADAASIEDHPNGTLDWMPWIP